MGFAGCTDVIIGMVRGLTPKTDTTHTYLIDEDADGRVIPLEGREASGQPRLCDLRMVAGPRDDGEAALSTSRLAVPLVLRVQYPAGGDFAHWQRIMVEDIGQLSLQLPQAVLESGATAAQLDSIPPPGVARIEDITDGDGTPIARRASIPFTMIYREQ